MTIEPPAFVLLGRLGDIINALPILKATADRFQCPVPLVVARSYANLLDGCSYVWPEVWEGHFWKTFNDAIAWAKTKHRDVVVLQTGGDNYTHSRLSTSFCLEAFAKTGLQGKRGTLPVVFDKRDPERERALVDRSKAQNPNPIFAYNLNGISSPFKDAELFVNELAKWSGVLNLVNTSLLGADHFYDLLGVFEASIGALTIDTATLHLLPAVQTDYIALVRDTDSPWHCSVPYGRCVLQVGYTRAASLLTLIHNRIGRMTAKAIVTHLYPKHAAGGDTLRRNSLAAYTWSRQNWTECGVDESTTGRWMDYLPGRRLPYVKDMIDFACKGKSDRDVIVFTNADSCVADHAMHESFWKLKDVECCYSNRRDFKRLQRPLSSAEVKGGEFYPGNDWFAFRVGWWLKHRDEYPDMLVGAEAWDCIMRMLMESTQSQPIVFTDFIYHEKHESPVYDHADNRMNLPTQKHNRGLAQAWMKSRNIDPKPHGL